MLSENRVRGDPGAAAVGSALCGTGDEERAGSSSLAKGPLLCQVWCVPGARAVLVLCTPHRAVWGTECLQLITDSVGFSALGTSARCPVCMNTQPCVSGDRDGLWQ